MELRELGKSGLNVAPLAFGGNVFGWTADEQMSFKLLDAFVAAGFNLIDTADVYSKWAPGHKGGESETVIGNWTKARGNREQLIIATKVGIEMSPDRKGLSAHYITRAVEDSLQRLQTDYIDLYQSHIDDKSIPLEETLGAHQKLIEQGKVRAIGASNYDSDRLAEALRVSQENGLPRYESLQPCYNLYDRQEYESGLEQLCVENDVGVIPYFPLAAGFLSGKYRSEADLSKSPRGQGVKKYLNERGMKILEALDQVAESKNSSPVRVALAWVAVRPGITAPIASATSLEQFEDLVEAMKLDLDEQSMDLLNRASAWE